MTCCARTACLNKCDGSHPGATAVPPSSLSSATERLCSQRIMWAFLLSTTGNSSSIVSAFSKTYLRCLCWLFQKIRSAGAAPVYKSISKQHGYAKSNANGFTGRVRGVMWCLLPLFSNCAMGLGFGMRSYENILIICRLTVMELVHIPSGVHWSMCGTHSSCHFYYQLPV